MIIVALPRSAHMLGRRKPLRPQVKRRPPPLSTAVLDYAADQRFGGSNMIAAWNSVIAGLPVLIVQLAVTTGIFIVGVAVYVLVTPIHELRLIRKGNVAAAVTLSGEMLALVIPLAVTMAHSVNVPDILFWGLISVGLQLIAFAVVAFILRDLPAAIERGDLAPALVLAAAQISCGVLNAAAMSG
jgi:putative membrane protein